MSSKTYCRVKVDLSNFFSDHRQLCLLLIQDKCKYVSDFEQHIKKVFGIDNFYLSVQDVCIPSNEDITILTVDDIIHVISTNIYTGKLEETVLNGSKDENTCKKSKRNKNLNIKDKETEVVVEPPKKIKKQKKIAKSEESNTDETQLSESTDIFNMEVTMEQEKNFDTLQPSVVNVKVITSNETIHAVADENPSKNLKLIHNTENEETPVFKEPSKKKRRLQKIANRALRNSMEANNEELHHEETKLPESVVAPNMEETVEPETNDKKDVTVQRNNFGYKNFGINSTMNYIRENMSRFDELDRSRQNGGVFVETENDDVDVTTNIDESFTMKRKRKRYRKKKDTSLNCTSDSPITPICKPTLKPLNSSKTSGVHIHFDEELASSKVPSNANSVTSENTDNTVEVKLQVDSKWDITDTDIEKCEPRTSSDDMSYDESTRVSHRPINGHNAKKNVTLKPEDIEMCPLMEALVPKLADIIAFKTVKLSSNYTPEVSSYIIGEVTNFDKGTQLVAFDIIDGRKEFDDPQGKFSLINEEETEAKHETHLKRIFEWPNLIETRLVYP